MSPTAPKLTNGKEKPIFAQNSLANGHPLITCSAISSSCCQISQTAVSTTFFLNKLDRLWILSCMSNHVKNWTPFGAELSQTKLAAGRGLPSRDFKSLYNPPESKGSTSAAHCIVKLCGDHQLSSLSETESLPSVNCFVEY